MNQKERRRDARMPLTIPVRVQGHDANGQWNEMTTSTDACYGGASFLVKHPVQIHQVLQLSLPLPKAFRQYSLTEQSYRVFALVRGTKSSGSGTRVGVYFLGKNPPRGYETNPAGHYLLPSDPPPPPNERRGSRRMENVFVNLKLKHVIEGGANEESTVAENMGKGGARVMTTLNLSKGQIIEIQEMGGDFHARAEVCNVYVGPDRVSRVNLHFLGAEPPDRLMTGR